MSKLHDKFKFVVEGEAPACPPKQPAKKKAAKKEEAKEAE